MTNTWLRPPPGTMPEGERLRRLRDWIWQYIRASLGDGRVRLNGPALDDPRARLPHNLNFALVGVCPKAFHQMPLQTLTTLKPYNPFKKRLKLMGMRPHSSWLTKTCPTP